MIPDLVTATRYIVMFVRTVDFDIVTAKTGGSLLLWRPDDGSRIALIPRVGGRVVCLQTDTFWVWHFANAFDNPDGTLTVDHVEWTYPSGFADAASTSALVRATCDPATKTITRRGGLWAHSTPTTPPTGRSPRSTCLRVRRSPQTKTSPDHVWSGGGFRASP